MADETPEPLASTLLRLHTERDAADRRYNEALTAVDRSIAPPVALPDPPVPLDDHQIPSLNETWDILPDTPAEPGGIKGRLTRFVWRLVAPYFERQVRFNSHLVDHLNRDAAARRESHRATAETTAALREQFARLVTAQSTLMVYLQQITAYVDTKDRETAGGALVLNAALSGMAENVDKRWETLTARDVRRDARLDESHGEIDELRGMVSLAQQSALAIKRRLEALANVASAQGQTTGQVGAQAPPGPPHAFAPSLDAYKYVGFEDRFRGSTDTIRARLATYVAFFDARGLDVLDVGCGRGEFLDLLAANGIGARGIDLNHEMAEGCRARGLHVTEADAVSYLESLADGSLGGIFAAQVVEHLQPGYLLRLLDLAFQKLQPGGRLVLETLNPACWVAFFESYIRDITHVWPLHPDTLQYLTTASGFSRVRVEFRSPVPPQDRLQPVAVPAGAGAVIADLADTCNANVEKINARMFTHMDYAIVAER